MIAQKDQYIQSAYNRLQVVSQDKQKRLEYEAREKAVRDYNQMILEAEVRGEERGEERVNLLFSFLIRDKRFEDLERATKDRAFQRQLMIDYNI